MTGTALRISAAERVPFAGNGLAAAAGLCAGSREGHVLYENGGRVRWAEGELAVVELRADGRVSVAVDGRRSSFSGGGAPLTAVGEALAEAGTAVAGERWRAYGWASFELSHLLSGSSRGSEPVLRLTVPEREIELDEGAAVLRARTEDELGPLRERLATASAAAGTELVEVDLEQGAEAYRRAVSDAVGAIRAGTLDKVILSRRVTVPGPIDLAATYLTGRRANAPARSFLVRQGDWEAAGFSPEIVATVTPDGIAVTQPLAGTRALVGDAELDRARRDELGRDPKEVYEHAISVRLSATELAEVCVPGSVRVGDFMSVRERGSVQHLGSEVTGRLRPGTGCWAALAALFPAVTASGIPKAAACRLIEEAEPGHRGLYSGAVLTVDSAGALDAALVLRSMFRRDGRTWLQAGAGIVAQSDPERELEETREKLRSISRFLVRAGS
ncbi:salicylate synthase [Amycolatopsis sp. Hca4]|uniref:salicylate synthase n=1 Tax=Amycolatopsis sp. Hca4 TaxID=2742131 RepID=UPI00159200C5|nr:salicylate synthase [Amycolatopsis sp. Hca4]QKV74034.1 salicylate synthase [Amycolatopsis sp. Hca4]